MCSDEMSCIPANNDPWFHMFCKWIHEFNWLCSRVSVREFTRFCEQIWCVDTCLPWNHEFFPWWQWNCTSSDPWYDRLMSNSFKTRDNRQNTYSREYTWKHVLVEQYQLWTSMTCVHHALRETLKRVCDSNKCNLVVSFYRVHAWNAMIKIQNKHCQLIEKPLKNDKHIKKNHNWQCFLNIKFADIQLSSLEHDM